MSSWSLLSSPFEQPKDAHTLRSGHSAVRSLTQSRDVAGLPPGWSGSARVHAQAPAADARARGRLCMLGRWELSWGSDRRLGAGPSG